MLRLEQMRIRADAFEVVDVDARRRRDDQWAEKDDAAVDQHADNNARDDRQAVLGDVHYSLSRFVPGRHDRVGGVNRAWYVRRATNPAGGLSAD
jgi:hypothetical protein